MSMTSVDSPVAADVSVPEVSDGPGREMIFGWGLAAVFFVLFLGWAAIAPLDAGAYGRGVIAVSGNRQAVQHRDGGVVTALHVQEGQMVQKGDVLLEISASELRANERGLTSQVYALLAQRARLDAERAGAAGFAAPREFNGLTGDDAAIARDAMHLQKLQFEARRAALVTQHAVLDQRARQLEQQIAGNNRQLDANRSQQKLIADELSGIKELAAKGYAPMTRVRSLERDAAGLVGADGAYQADIAKAEEGIGETRMQAASIDKQQMDDVTSQMRDVDVKLGQLQPALVSARDKLEHAYVRAPATGQVVGLTAFTVGGVVAAGQTVAEVVPTNRSLVLQITISPNDADDLQIGQKVQVRFPALHERDLPILEGYITKLSADSFADEKTGQRFYRGEVSVTPQELEIIHKVRGRDVLRPGLPVEVVIPVRKRTALQYLLEPLTQTFWRSFLEH